MSRAGGRRRVRLRAVRRVVLGAVAVALLTPDPLPAQTLTAPLPASAADPRTPEVMRDLAERIIPIYHDPDRPRYLATLSVLQETAGSWASAYAARLSLAELGHQAPVALAHTPDVLYEMHVRARAVAAQTRIPYVQALEEAYQAMAGSLDNLAAHRLGQWLSASPAPQQAALDALLERHRGQDRIALADALDLIEAYAAYDTQRSLAPLAGPLVAADNQRRYVIDELQIAVAPAATVAAVMVRPRVATGRLPAVLTLAEDPLSVPGPAARDAAVISAAHGFLGVVAGERIAAAKAPAPGRHTPRPPGADASGQRPPADGGQEPFTHEGADARAVIRWIAAQPGSDGRIALQGQGYGAWVAWDAARRAPPGLAALVVTSALAPGINLPMEGGIFRSDAYRWLLQVSRAPGGEAEGPGDDARWQALDARWVASGRPYRDLDRIYGVPSAVFQRWLDHPSLDAYWRQRLPTARELSRLTIPVLTVTGYYDSGETGALYYFARQRQARPSARHILLAGPYDVVALAGTASAQLRAYPLDPAARIDLTELRHQWLDHVLRGAPRPALLAGTVNYEVMGTDSWRHAEAFPQARRGVKLYLAPAPAASGGQGSGKAPGPQRLQPDRPSSRACVALEADPGSREPADGEGDPPLLAGSLKWHDALLFVSERLPAPVELAGQPVLHLKLIVSRRDVDLTTTLYAQLPDGRYLMLHAPPYEQRASYGEDPATRQLLTPGQLTSLTLASPRLVAVKLPAGSRLVLLAGVKRRADEELNQGTGGDVSREARTGRSRPITVRWCRGSYLEVPASR